MSAREKRHTDIDIDIDIDTREKRHTDIDIDTLQILVRSPHNINNIRSFQKHHTGMSVYINKLTKRIAKVTQL